MVSGKGYKGSRSRGISTKTSDHPSLTQTLSKNEQNTAGNESFMGATLPGVERTGGWRGDPNFSRTTNCH